MFSLFIFCSSAIAFSEPRYYRGFFVLFQYNSAAVTKIPADKEALPPFSDEGASRISDVYEITLTANISDGAEILVTHGSLAAIEDTSHLPHLPSVLLLQAELLQYT